MNSTYVDSDFRRPRRNIVLLGPPAGGKGTQADFLNEHYGMVHVSTGDLLRARAKFLPDVSRAMDSGQLVSDEIITSLLKERLDDNDCQLNGVLLDGFPRTHTQAVALESAGVAITLVINLEVADDVVVDRISGRRIDPRSGKIYHVRDNPPPPDIEHRVIQRVDDTMEKVKRRLKVYHAERDAIISFYGSRVKSIKVGYESADSLPSDVLAPDVFKEVRKVIDGDTFWGSVVRSEVIPKSYECGTYSTALVTVARYFEHARFRLVHNGCLVHASRAAVHAGARAQAISLKSNLRPSTRYQLRTWLQHVGTHSVVVGHAMSQRVAGGDIVDVAHGSASVVFYGKRNEALAVPRRADLRRLIVPSSSLRSFDSSLDIDEAKGEEWIQAVGDPPEACRWTTVFVAAGVDVDINGRLHEAAAFQICDRFRFDAACNSGYNEIICKKLQAAHLRRAYLKQMGPIMEGNLVEVTTWQASASPEGEAVPAEDVIIAFQFHRPGNTSAVLILAVLVLSSSRGRFSARL